MTNTKRILITPGEPAGIGPDITLQIAKKDWPDELVVIADPTLLLERAKQLHLPIQLIESDLSLPPSPHQAHTLKIIPIKFSTSAVAGKLNVNHAEYVIRTLETAAKLCIAHEAHALVTGPVHKGIINDAGIAFSGHTEFFANYCNVPHTVMLFVVDKLKIALATTHLPLRNVANAITASHLELTIDVLQKGLKRDFHIKNPRILVCGLNPHAGENGHLGQEEVDIIAPLLAKLNKENYHLEGPYSADTIFTPKYLKKSDAILAMFHDQALPLVKYIGFGSAVNVTLGLPFIRTSVDHGTALDIAGKGVADASSLEAAIKLALTL